MESNKTQNQKDRSPKEFIGPRSEGITQWGSCEGTRPEASLEGNARDDCQGKEAERREFYQSKLVLCGVSQQMGNSKLCCQSGVRVRTCLGLPHHGQEGTRREPGAHSTKCCCLGCVRDTGMSHGGWGLWQSEHVKKPHLQIHHYMFSRTPSNNRKYKRSSIEDPGSRVYHKLEASNQTKDSLQWALWANRCTAWLTMWH